MPLAGPLAKAPVPSLADKDIIDDTIRDYGCSLGGRGSFRISLGRWVVWIVQWVGSN